MSGVNRSFGVVVVRAVLSFFLAGSVLPAFSQILSYTDDVSGALSVVATNATGLPLSRVNGAATPGAPCGSGYSVSAFTSATVYSSSQPAIEVTVTPEPGFTLNVTGFSVALRRSGSGPVSARFAYSTDGGINWIDQAVDHAPNDAACGITTTGTWATTFTVPAPLGLMFRVYGYNAGSPSATLQLLNLVINGSVVASATCPVPPGLTATLTTASSATLNWSAIPGAAGYNVRYRPTAASTWITTFVTGTTLVASGLTAGTVYECQVEADCSPGTSGYSPLAYFTTTPGGVASASSGSIVVYFNHPVNTAVSTGVDAVYLNDAMDDTLIAYIDRAKYTLDIAQYNYNQSTGYSSIADAVNSAVARGVRVRWIYDGGESNTGLALLDTAVHTLASPTTGSYGLMHNKFFIIDANSADPNDAIVSTGSTVWGVNQFNNDWNNIVFIQDSALAHAYLDHFNMMWGDTGYVANLTLSRFGPFKSDLGRHIFTIGGKTVELYFSPSDHTDSHIQSAINSADSDLYFGMFTFTMAADANAIVSRHTAGVYTPGIVDENSTLSSPAYPILTAGLGSLMKTKTGSPIYHNKMLIVDPSNTCSDPLVLTGSHNWTNAAETRNDENTIIIHNDTIANIFYQSFHADYSDLGGTLTPIGPCTMAGCGTPTGLTASTTTTTAILNWAVLSGAVSYTVQYRESGASTWSTTATAFNTATITGLLPATVYEFRVAAICTSGTGAYTPVNVFTTMALPCTAPSGLSVSGIDTDIATLNWVAVSGAVGYTVEYRVAGAATWTSIPAATNTLTLSMLTPATVYEFRVQVICTTGSSPFSGVSAFTTDTVPVVSGCTAPLAAVSPATGVTESAAVLNWLSVPAATGYNVRYRKAGVGAWSNTSATTNWLIVYGLSPGTAYEFQVQAVCSSSETSSYSAGWTFSTSGTSGVTSLEADDTKSLSLYPNPTTKDVVLAYELTTAGKVSISVYDMVGKRVVDVTANEQQQRGRHRVNIELPAAGVYFVRLSVGSYTATGRVVRF